MEKAIASLLILSGDENPELVKTYVHFLQSLHVVWERETLLYPMKLIESWWSWNSSMDLIFTEHGIPDFLVTFWLLVPWILRYMQFKYKFVPKEDNTNHYYLGYGVGGPGFIYYNPTDKDLGGSFSAIGKALKDKWTEYRNRKKGYTLTKVTED